MGVGQALFLGGLGVITSGTDGRIEGERLVQVVGLACAKAAPISGMPLFKISQQKLNFTPVNE